MSSDTAGDPEVFRHLFILATPSHDPNSLKQYMGARLVSPYASMLRLAIVDKTEVTGYYTETSSSSFPRCSARLLYRGR